MFSRKKEGEKTYTQTEVDFLLGEARHTSRKEGYQSGLNAAVCGNENLEQRYELMSKRKRELAIKMVDAIAKGHVERLLEEWDDKWTTWSTKND